MEKWEKIISQLFKRTDFNDESCYYAVRAISKVGSSAPLTAENGRYSLEPGKEYQVDLYHFYPTDIPLTTTLTFSTANAYLRFTTNPKLFLDSRYDLKQVRFKTGKPVNEDPAVISINRGRTGQDEYLDFDLLATIKGTFWRTLGYGVLLGALLGATPMASTITNPNLTTEKIVYVCSISGAIGLLTGILAAFGLKKSP